MIFNITKGPKKFVQLFFLNKTSESEVAQSCPTLCDPMDVAHQAPLFLGFSRQKYWSGLPCPPPGDLPSRRIEPRSPTLQADSLPSEAPEKPKNTGVVAYPSSRGSSRPRNQPGVSCTASGFFTS